MPTRRRRPHQYSIVVEPDLRRAHARGVALMIVAPLLWSMAGVLTRQIESAGRWEIVGLRSLFCAVGIVLGAAYLYRGRMLRELLALGGTGLASSAMWATMFTCFMLALTRTTVANTLVLSSLAPITASVFAVIILRERISARTWTLALVALAGVGIMFGDGAGRGGWAGNLAALGVPLAAGLNFVLMRKTGATVNLVPAIFVGGVISAAATLPFALPFTATPRDLAIAATLGFFQLALPCTLVVIAARVLSPTEVALFGLLEVIFGTLWAWIGAGERPADTTLVGGAVVLAALIAEATARGRSARAVTIAV